MEIELHFENNISETKLEKFMSASENNSYEYLGNKLHFRSTYSIHYFYVNSDLDFFLSYANTLHPFKIIIKDFISNIYLLYKYDNLYDTWIMESCAEIDENRTLNMKKFNQSKSMIKQIYNKKIGRLNSI